MNLNNTRVRFLILLKLGEFIAFPSLIRWPENIHKCIDREGFRPFSPPLSPPFSHTMKSSLSMGSAPGCEVPATVRRADLPGESMRNNSVFSGAPSALSSGLGFVSDTACEQRHNTDLHLKCVACSPQFPISICLTALSAPPLPCRGARPPSEAGGTT